MMLFTGAEPGLYPDELFAKKVLLLRIDSYESACLNTQIIHMF